MYSREQLLDTINNKNVEFLRLQFTDIQGMVKSVSIPVNRLGKALDSGTSFDGSSIEGFARIQESDMVLHPDISSFSLLPWKAKGDKNVGRLICDVYKPSGEPFEGDPRNVLARMMQKAEDIGYTMNVGPELEFFLFNRVNGKATTEPHDSAGYFDFAPIDLAEDIRREIMLALTEMGLKIEAAHHELAMGQHEIDFTYGEALRTADNVVTFRYVTKTIAMQNGLAATFMPKPVYGAAGSGMHINISLFKDGENAFYDPEGPMQLSDLARYFAGGLLDHSKAITAVTNPLVNSYKRLVSGFEAPVYISWSGPNRSSLIRVPSGRGLSTRLEMRSPDPSCCPYLAFAVVLAAGLDGIKKKIDPGDPIDMNIYELSETERTRLGIETLPSDLREALSCLEEDKVIRDALGEHVYTNLNRLGSLEWDSYNTHVHPWEVNRYINII